MQTITNYGLEINDQHPATMGGDTVTKPPFSKRRYITPTLQVLTGLEPQSGTQSHINENTNGSFASLS